MDHRDHCRLTAAEVDRFAVVLTGLDPARPVPSCPGWTVADLASHVGTVHRWAGGLVRTRATRPQGRSGDVVDPGPPSPAWIRDGGADLLEALGDADPDAPMWAWGPDHHVRFWSRRMLHETLVHRVDAELTGGAEPVVDAEVASDGIDELLDNLPSAAAFSPGVRRLRGRGEVLAVRPADVDRAWRITLEPGGFTVGEDPDRADAALSGPAADLLVVLYRRRPLAGAGVAVEGDRSLVERWLADSALG